MKILGDYHTHTTFSHGKDSVLSNAQAAGNAGLKEIAITDHGFRHIIYAMRPSKIESFRAKIEEARSELPYINILMGIEANIIGAEGAIDIPKEKYSDFDIILCGYHKFVYADRLSDYFKLHWSSLYQNFFRPTKTMLKYATHAVTSAIAKNPIDVLTHINYGLIGDSYEIAKAASDYGALIELNGKRINLSSDEFEKMLKTKVQFIINSDAHSSERVGDFALGIDYIKDYDIADRIVNVDKLPNFPRRKK